jgi:hypothetical protein
MYLMMREFQKYEILRYRNFRGETSATEPQARGPYTGQRPHSLASVFI